MTSSTWSFKEVLLKNYNQISSEYKPYYTLKPIANSWLPFNFNYLKENLKKMVLLFKIYNLRGPLSALTIEGE